MLLKISQVITKTQIAHEPWHDIKSGGGGRSRIPKKCRPLWSGDEENFSKLIVSKRSKKPIKYFSLSLKLIQIMF